LSNNQRGILAIVACMAAYTVNDVLVKQILLHYPAGETIFLRGCMSTVLLCAAMLAMGHARTLRTPVSAALAWRSVCDGLSTAGFIAALAHMQLANVAAVLQIAPLLITALSVVLFGERVGWRRWSAVGLGFAGALLVIKPVPSAFDIWAVVGAASALAAALREILTRRIGLRSPAIVVGLWGAVGITLLGLPFIAVEDWRMFERGDLLQLLVASVFVGVAIYLLAVAFRDVDLSVIAPFRYSYLLTSAAGGFLVFAEVPDQLTVLGALMIVGSGIYALHREAAERRNLTATANTAV
jgi:drug/metabolite transporter (DMT)-like permease